MLNQETLNSLKRSPIYKALESVGLNSEHLESICLYDNRDGFRLSNWSYKFSPSISPEAFYYLKPFPVLRCLLENGISSADREAAWEYVAFAEKIAEDDLAEKAKRRLQSQRAKRTRGKIFDDGSTARQIVESLCKKYPDFTARQLWRSFIFRLENENLHPDLDQGRERLTFETASGQARRISYRRFANLVSEVRSKKPSRQSG